MIYSKIFLTLPLQEPSEEEKESPSGPEILKKMGEALFNTDQLLLKVDYEHSKDKGEYSIYLNKDDYFLYSIGGHPFFASNGKSLKGNMGHHELKLWSGWKPVDFPENFRLKIEETLLGVGPLKQFILSTGIEKKDLGKFWIPFKYSLTIDTLLRGMKWKKTEEIQNRKANQLFGSFDMSFTWEYDGVKLPADNLDFKKEGINIVLWVDDKTNLPLKRVLILKKKDQEERVTEHFKSILRNKEIPKDSSELKSLQDLFPKK